MLVGLAVITLLVLALAWVNGANDVAKGVATLAGSGASNAKRAILWGTLWTVVGGMAAVFWGSALMSTFSSGFLAPGFRVDLTFVAGTLMGAFVWILAATRLGLPVSTTHALLGGVIGAVLTVTGPDGLHAAAVANKALLPLFISPLIAIVLCWGLLFLGRFVVGQTASSRSRGWTDKDAPKNPFEHTLDRSTNPLSSEHHRIWTALHWVSSAATSFARGLNDVPKIAAFLTLTIALVPGLAYSFDSLGSAWPILAVALAMGLGSFWGGFRVLRVLAHRVVPLDASRGLAANVGTSVVVLMATPLGLPVSTTHVSTGALMGVRLADKAKPNQVDALRLVLFGWVVTLPVAAAVSAISVWSFKSF